MRRPYLAAWLPSHACQQRKCVVQLTHDWLHCLV